MALRKTRTDDIESLYAWEREGWKSEFVQIEPGKLGFRSVTSDLDGLVIARFRHHRRIVLREKRLKPGAHFALLLAAEHLPQVNGRAVQVGEGQLVRQGDYVEYLIPAGVVALSAELDAPLLGSLGWEFAGEGVQRVSPVARRRLESVLRDTTGSTRLLRREAIAALRLALAPWLDRGRSTKSPTESQLVAYHRLVQRAGRHMAKLGFEEKLSVPELAQQLSVSERTLYRAFEHCVGAGPADYFRIHRLHAFRNRLLRSAGRGKSPVQQAAHDTGFDHLGRLAADYRHHFGELPSDTLARRRGKPD